MYGGSFNQVIFVSEELLKIEQWGTTQWATMYHAFYGCKNMDVTAIDKPDLSDCHGLSEMFQYCENLVNANSSISNWNTQSITDMSYMFNNASNFNQPLNWNTQNVTNMSTMFSGATSFNQPIGNWDTQNVTDMSYMFLGATSFNQPLTNWNTENVTNMSTMFSGATSFNQPLTSFDTKNVTDMGSMFSRATSFNQPLTNFDTKNVTDMSSMFSGATSFNQPLTSFDTKNVTDMGSMFFVATAFNQPLTNFNTQNVTNMSSMFYRATAFDQPISSFRIDAVVLSYYMTSILSGCGMSCRNLSTTLDSWKTQAATLNKNNIYLGDITTVHNAYNETGRDAIAALKARGWTINGGQFVPGCITPDVYVSEWDMSKQVWPARPDAATTLVTNLVTGELGCNVEWENLNDPTDKGIVNIVGTQANPIKITGLRANAKYRVVAYSTTNNNGYELAGLCAEKADYQRLTKVTQWGTNQWTSLTKAFSGCGNMDITATDKPDLSSVTDLTSMFQNCTSLEYNSSINDWNVSNVTNMSNTFSGTLEFNQPLNNWDVSKVTNMSSMFRYTDAFNQDITGWNVSAVTNMQSMFERALVFNQDIKGWNTRNVTDMSAMFMQATAFDRDLGLLRIDALTNGYGMFASSGMSCDNYSKTLKGWAESSHTPSNVNFATQTGTPYGRHGMTHRKKLVSQKNWTISGDNLDFACSLGLITPDVYVTEWDMSKPAKDTRSDAATTLFTNFLGTNFVVEYINLADPTDKGIELNANGVLYSPFKLTGLRANAKYRLIAYANPGVPGSVFKGLDAFGSDAKRLSKVTQWGTNEWKSLTSAFYNCENMDVTATDRPTLTGGISLASMFQGCTSLVYNPSINNWLTADVTNMVAMFSGATSFNQPIGNWNTGSVTDMTAMFLRATSFNQPIGNWNTGNVTSMAYMFEGATSFNQPIVNWNMVSVNIVEDMFHNAASFDQPLDGLKFDSHPSMGNMLYNSGISCHNLSVTFDAWATQATALNYTGVTLNLDANKYYNAQGQTALNILTTAPLNWLITGGTYAPNCLTPNDWFVAVWDMSKPTNRINSPNTTIAFPGNGTNYRLDWEDVNNPTLAGRYGTVTVSSSSSLNPYILTVPASGIYRIKVHKDAGVFYGFDHFASSYCDNKRLIRVEQWGTTKWGSLSNAFANCSNMDITATDVPDLTGAPFLFLYNMFDGCSSLVNANGSMANWNTDRVKDMFAMFQSTPLFNVPIGNWNTRNVTRMSQMFSGATSFNQPLNWNIENVTDMSSMFSGAIAFNQPFGSSWNTQSVTNMSYMFGNATAFNQDISSWNTQNVTEMVGMFSGVTSFDQPLSSIKINSVVSGVSHGMYYMLSNSGISCENLSSTLDSWNTQAAALNKNNINLGGITTIPNAYNEMVRDAITALTARGWTITGGRFARDCVSPDYYVSVWDLSKPDTTGTATALTTNLWGGNFTVEWKNLDDGTTGMIASATATTAPLTITGLTAGKRYRVVAYPNSTPGSILKKLATEDGGGITRTDVARLDSVTQWGVNKWMSLEGAFRHCSRMDVTATDVPDLTTLSGNKSLNFMFEGCENLVYNSTINNWVTTGVTDMSGMFSGAKAFNQPLDGWDVSNVKYMASMFFKAETFNQDLNSWQTGNVERMQDIFNSAKAFNGNITTWNTGKVTNMQAMFYGAEAFNKALGWNTENVTDMSSMFQNAKAFNNGTIMNAMGYWNVEKVTTMKNMFLNAEAFDQDLAGWTLRSITDMRDIFSAPLNKGMSCAKYSSSLQGWASNPLTKTGVDFTGQSNRVYNAVGKIARDSLSKPVAQGGKGWNMSATTDSYDESCGMHIWMGTVSTDISDINNWQNGTGMPPHIGIVSGYEYNVMVYISPSAVRDMHVTPLPVTPPYTPGAPNNLGYWIIHNLVNKTTNRKVVVEPAANLYIHNWIDGSSTPADADKIVIKADDTNPNGSLILGGQPCDKPVYATVEMYSKAGREATAMTWTDNIPSSPTKDSLFSVHYRWQYIGVPVDGEVANAFYGSYLRKYDETYNDPNHYYGKWRKLGANETWQPLVPFAGYEVTSRTPKVYVFKGRLLHCTQELTLTRQAAEVSAVHSSFTDPRERHWELGHNVFGNSYTSALMIGQGKLFVDLEGRYPLGQEPIEGTVYIYIIREVLPTGQAAVLSDRDPDSTLRYPYSVPQHSRNNISRRCRALC